MNEAFEYVVFSVITVFVILYSVYLALIREDDEEESDEEEGGKEGRTANIDDDDDDDDASTSAAARSSVLSKLTNELKETMSVGNERVKKSARNMVDAWRKRGERKEATKESTSMSFMGAFFGGKKKTKTDRTDGSSLLDYTSSGDDVVSLSVNEEDFFEEDVLETDDEAMWAPYFREEEQGEDQRSYRNNSTITRNIARNLHGGL